MKCPYRGFADCIMQECPSCKYEEVERKVIGGRKLSWMSDDEAIDRGCTWEETRTEYKFVACKLIEAGAQPVPQKKEVINNTTVTRVTIKKSVF